MSDAGLHIKTILQVTYCLQGSSNLVKDKILWNGFLKVEVLGTLQTFRQNPPPPPPQSVQLTYFTHTHWSNNRLAFGPNVNMAEPCSSFLQGAALSARPCSVRAFRGLGPDVNTTKPCNSAHDAVWRKLGPLVLIRGYLMSSSVGPHA
jgi:hypothetical protein